MTARICQMLMGLNSRYPDFKPFKVFMSGTPIDATPTDVLGVLTALHDKDWEDDPTHEMYCCRPSHIEKLGTEMSSLIRRNVGVDDPDFKRITAEPGAALPLFLFRRNESSKWFGHPLVVLPDMRFTTYRIPFPGDCQKAKQEINQAWIVNMQRKLAKAIEAWKGKSEKTGGPQPVKVTDHTFEGVSRKLRIVATLPWMAKYWQEHPENSFTHSQILARSRTMVGLEKESCDGEP